MRTKSGISITCDSKIIEEAKGISHKNYKNISQYIEEAIREKNDKEGSDNIPEYVREHAKRLADSQNELRKHKAIVEDELEFFKRHNKYKEVINKE